MELLICRREIAVITWYPGTPAAAAITIYSILTHHDWVIGMLDTSAESESASTWVRCRLLFYTVPYLIC